MIRALLGLLVCAAALLPATPPAAAQSWTKLERVELYGNEYVRLKQWADLYGFTCARKDDDLIVSNKWTRMVFTINSRQAQIKGINVYLSVTIARRGDDYFISPLDLRTTVHPLLYPSQSGKVKIRTICLDPGHGGRDPGNLEGKTQEKKCTLLLAQELQKQLKAAGLKTVMTRTDDTFSDPSARPDYARKQKADLFVSLHFNSSTEESVKGVETYCLTPAHASSTNARGEGASTGAYDANKNDSRNILFAWHVHRALTKELDALDRGVRRARYAVLKFAAMPAILVEGGYMTNPSEGKNLTDPDYRRQMAHAIVEGILAYRKALELK